MKRGSFRLSLLAVSRGKNVEPAGPLKEYRLTGVVVSYDADRKAAPIRHEKIEGLMEAMTMEFPVRDEGAAPKPVPGQRITARLFQRESDDEYLDLGHRNRGGRVSPGSRGCPLWFQWPRIRLRAIL